MKYSIKQYPELKNVVENMSVEEMLWTVVCPHYEPDLYGVPRNTGAMFIHPRKKEEALKITKMINDGRENPALIVADMESGAGGAIRGAVKFPSLRAFTEGGTAEDAYEMGKAAAIEGRNSGYHWTFGPCIDINCNKINPIVMNRSAGDDVEKIIELSGAYVDGLQDNGLIATLKHFPGDGSCFDDQHITTPSNMFSKDEWDKTYGKTYKTLIDRGVKAIMPGHIALPAYDERDKNGVYPPATASKNLLTGLLREKLGFEGLIVSDGANMGGFCNYKNLYEACCAFLEAGGDCILFIVILESLDEYIVEMKKCIEKGCLSMDVLKDRAYRMLCFSKEYFNEFSLDKELEFDREAAETVSKRVSQNAVKIARNRAGTLPLKINKESRIAHIILHPVWTPDGNLKYAREVERLLSERVKEIETFVDPGCEQLRRIARFGGYDYILCSVIEDGSFGINTARLTGPVARNMMNGWMRYETPVVFVGYYNPYFGDTYEAAVDTIINAFGCGTDYFPEAIVDKLING